MNATAAPGLFTRLAGLILLAVFGAGQLQAMPLLTAAVAVLDGGHRVELTAGRNGARLVLHHDGGAARFSGHHHRGLMCFIAGVDDRGPHPDHYLFFAAASNLEKEQDTPAPAVKGAASDCLVARSAGYSVRVPWLDRSTHQRGPLSHCWWPPPPAECVWGCVVLLV